MLCLKSAFNSQSDHLIQVYTASKPCIVCGSDLASAKTTTYWEGGKGCRSRTKMSRYRLELCNGNFMVRCGEFIKVSTYCVAQPYDNYTLCRKDKHKYSNTSAKTSSQKMERVGKEGKNKRSWYLWLNDWCVQLWCFNLTCVESIFVELDKNLIWFANFSLINLLNKSPVK